MNQPEETQVAFPAADQSLVPNTHVNASQAPVTREIAHPHLAPAVTCSYPHRDTDTCIVFRNIFKKERGEGNAKACFFLGITVLKKAWPTVNGETSTEHCAAADGEQTGHVLLARGASTFIQMQNSPPYYSHSESILRFTKRSI